jgi:hypothetical protein
MPPQEKIGMDNSVRPNLRYCIISRRKKEEGRRKKKEGRRKKEEVTIIMVAVIKIFLTLLVVNRRRKKEEVIIIMVAFIKNFLTFLVAIIS